MTTSLTLRILLIAAVLGTLSYSWWNRDTAPPASSPSSGSVAEAGTPERAEPAILQSKTDSQGDVDITLTPRFGEDPQNPFKVEVEINTHSIELGDDLAQAIELRDARGTMYKPQVYEGDPPGGHHRKGVVRFEKLDLRSESFEIEVRGVGGIQVRTFRWEQ